MQKKNQQRVRFQPGKVFVTRGIRDLLTQIEVLCFLAKHVRGDWGICCPEDAQRNEEALIDGTRIFSAYRANCGSKIWIITEADRSSTMVLLPEEY
ncbi:MAG: hypothetical protein NXI32_22095 [bacterium]|nr:hypothetical protein [bacterium]